MSELLRRYGAHELGPDGYPYRWHGKLAVGTTEFQQTPIKDLIRKQAGHRCERCGHPYPEGIALDHPRGEWTPCDEHCDHDGPWMIDGFVYKTLSRRPLWPYTTPHKVYAGYRILTVHHLDEDKANCLWWNLAALCQRCHLAIQGRVKMQQLYVHPHSEWFKPHAAGYYASTYLGEELIREEVMARLDELLALELDPSYGP